MGQGFLNHLNRTSLAQQGRLGTLGEQTQDPAMRAFLLANPEYAGALGLRRLPDEPGAGPYLGPMDDRTRGQAEGRPEAILPPVDPATQAKYLEPFYLNKVRESSTAQNTAQAAMLRAVVRTLGREMGIPDDQIDREFAIGASPPGPPAQVGGATPAPAMAGGAASLSAPDTATPAPQSTVRRDLLGRRSGAMRIDGSGNVSMELSGPNKVQQVEIGADPDGTGPMKFGETRRVGNTIVTASKRTTLGKHDIVSDDGGFVVNTGPEGGPGLQAEISRVTESNTKLQGFKERLATFDQPILKDDGTPYLNSKGEPIKPIDVLASPDLGAIVSVLGYGPEVINQKGYLKRLANRLGDPNLTEEQKGYALAAVKLRQIDLERGIVAKDIQGEPGNRTFEENRNATLAGLVSIGDDSAAVARQALTNIRGYADKMIEVNNNYITTLDDRARTPAIPIDQRGIPGQSPRPRNRPSERELGRDRRDATPTTPARPTPAPTSRPGTPSNRPADGFDALKRLQLTK